MAIKLACPHCEHVFDDEEWAEAGFDCPHCGESLQV